MIQARFFDWHPLSLDLIGRERPLVSINLKTPLSKTFYCQNFNGLIDKDVETQLRIAQSQQK